MTAEYTEYENLCSVILESSSKVQSVAIINKMGRPVERVSRDVSASQFLDKTSEMLYMQSVLQVSMGRDFDEHYGPINYHVSERTSVTLLTFPLGKDHVVLLTASKNSSPISLAKKIATIIRASAEKPKAGPEGHLIVNA